MEPDVPTFYTDKTVFITGATGFVGKVLLEKLLRSCPGIRRVYVLMRAKKGQSAEDRAKAYANNAVFTVLREQNPNFAAKIQVIPGDILAPGLGLTDGDRQLLTDSCQIIFHSAACVRFDQPLKDAVRLNTGGTLSVLQLAEDMPLLEVFVHLSTSYCRCELATLEERVYDADPAPARVLDLLGWMSDEWLQKLEPCIIGNEPNTYSYTKALTETLVGDFGHKFPIAITRPSIVTASWKEPMPGWVDNINGPTGLLIGAGKGVIRSMLCEAAVACDCVPVDVIVNGCILAAHATALDRPKEVKVYNLTLSGCVDATWGDVVIKGKEIIRDVYPFEQTLWYPGGSIKSHPLTHAISVALFHYLPAYFLDALLFVLGKKPFMVRVQNKVQKGLLVLQYYTMKAWHFRNENFVNLHKRLSSKDNEVFYTDIWNLNVDEYLKSYVLGVRQYCCGEDPASLPRARRINYGLFLVDRLFKILFFCFVFYYLFHFLLKIADVLDRSLSYEYEPFNQKSL